MVNLLAGLAVIVSMTGGALVPYVPYVNETPPVASVKETKEETKEEIKEEIKEETKEETKEEIKEETKEEIKEETKEEIKEETKEEVVQVKKFDYDIASYITKYSGKESINRNYNIRLASDSINGTILNPGDTFSYNDTILSKSHNGKDYKTAEIFVNGKTSTGIGGGICQISSTLYQAALYSGMTITERRNHSLRVGYMPAGRDATASWGSIDFRFRNDLKVPVMIESVMNNGVIKIRFLSQENPNIGEIKVNVTQKNGTYYLSRIRADGKVDHTSTSRYQTQKPKEEKPQPKPQPKPKPQTKPQNIPQTISQAIPGVKQDPKK